MSVFRQDVLLLSARGSFATSLTDVHDVMCYGIGSGVKGDINSLDFTLKMVSAHYIKDKSMVKTTKGYKLASD